MPELPEVETIVRRFRRRLVGRRIMGFAAVWPRQVLPSVARVRRAVVGRRIAAFERRGKWLLVGLDDGSCLGLHLKMSGRLEWRAACPETPRHVRAVLRLDGDDAVLFCDARKFGRLRHATDCQSLTAALGPEPLAAGFTPATLAARLRGYRRALKAMLLDQRVVAGLGNIYTDEALFRAGLHPLRRADSLSPTEIGRLHRGIRSALRDGIRHNGTSFDWIYPGGRMQDFLRVYGRCDLPCRRCRTPIRSLRVAQRTTCYCPRCQPKSGRTGIRRPERVSCRRRGSA